MMACSHTRTETDSFGPIEVPGDSYWGAQTERSIENFPFGPREQMPAEIVHALGYVKQAAARVNARIGGLDAEIAEAIQQAAGEVARGDLDGQFPLVIWQTGSGTQSNMNANEVIAGRANEMLTGTRGGKEPVHPNDHVNKGQSSNDSFPTAMHIAAGDRGQSQAPAGAQDDPRPARRPGEALGRDRQDRPHPSAGRNSAHAGPGIFRLCGDDRRQYRAGRRRAAARACGSPRAEPRSAPASTRPRALPRPSPRKSPTSPSCRSPRRPNKFAELAAHDTLVELSGVLNTIAVSLTKIANDIRLLGSGPRCGLGELKLPENEPGSSIMPGKVNPTQCEMLTMVAAQVMGNHVAVTVGGLQGHLELNVFKPLIGANVIRSINLLTVGMESFTERTLDGLEPDEERIAELMNRSLMLVTALAPEIGYDNAATIAKHAHKKGHDAEGSGARAGPGRRADLRPGGQAGDDAWPVAAWSASAAGPR